MRMKKLVPVLVALLLAACASGHQKFYKPYVDISTLQDVRLLSKDERPEVFRSSDMRRDILIARSRGYVPVGQSSFNGEMESEDAVVAQARRLGAVLALVESSFTGTQSVTTPLFLPNTQTTYSSGTVTGLYGSANYSGTSTTYGSTVVPITTQQQRHDQTAVYFVKMTKKLRFGLSVLELTPEIRAKLERNSGALVEVVVEGTPAFVGNILPGDVLVELNETPITNAKHALEVMRLASPPNGKCTVKVMRNGVEKIITLQLES